LKLLLAVFVVLVAFFIIRRASRRKQPESQVGMLRPVPRAASKVQGVPASSSESRDGELAEGAEESERAVEGTAREQPSEAVTPWSTQFNRADEDRPPIDAVMGLDFGTSSTKVVIQNPTLAGGRSVAVPFGNLAHPSSAYLLPTTLYMEENDRLTLDSASDGLALGDIKVRLMEDPDDRDAVVWAGVYLALAIREARGWYLNSQHRDIGHRRLRWSMNLGIPSAGYDDEDIARGFGRAAALAWRLSVEEQSVDLALARELESGDLDPGIELAVVPEVAAEVVGYARSPRRRNGLHVLLDVGATTVDVCGFVLDEREGEDRYNLLTAIVESLGAHRLHAARMSALEKSGARADSGVLEWEDPLTPIPDDLAGYVKDGPVPEELHAANESFRKRAVTPLMATLMALKRNRDPNSIAFREGLPIFLCGGGSQMRFYRSVVKESEQRFKSVTTATSVIPMTLEKPLNLSNEDVDELAFSRLAVAYGLSFDSLDIGEIQRPSEIEDIEVRRASSRDDFVSKDQV